MKWYYIDGEMVSEKELEERSAKQELWNLLLATDDAP